MSNQNILFFSKYCNHCTRYINALNKTKARNSFIRICVDTRNIRLPSFVQRVPTIIVYDNNRHRHILSDKNAFEWLNMFLTEPEDIQGFSQGELSSSLSDTYALISDGESGASSSSGFDHNFAFLNNLNDTYIHTPQDIDMPGNDFRKTKDSELERLREQREREVPSGRRGPAPRLPNDYFSQDTRQQSQDQNQKLDFDFQRFQNARNGELRRGPTPQHAPNFQSAQFEGDPYFQSNRGGSYQPAGGFGGGRQRVIGDTDIQQMRNDRANFRYMPQRTTPDFTVHRGN